MKFKRIILIVIDSVGIGTCPDSYQFGDDGANTIGHISESREEGIHLPNMESLGYGKIAPIRGLSSTIKVNGIYGKMQELSKGKDTMTGHWEMMGIVPSSPQSGSQIRNLCFSILRLGHAFPGHAESGRDYPNILHIPGSLLHHPFCRSRQRRVRLGCLPLRFS